MLVIKVGGSEGIDYDAVCDDVAQLVGQGRRLILIHGGSHLTNQVAEQLGHPPSLYHLTQRLHQPPDRPAHAGNFPDGLLRPDEQGTGRAVAGAGRQCGGIVGARRPYLAGARKKAVRAVVDGRTVIVRDNYTGTVETVNTACLPNCSMRAMCPFSPRRPSARGRSDQRRWRPGRRGHGRRLRAGELLILSNVPGVLRDFPDERSLIPHIRPGRH
jgi:[amino group carrier protein]-L-2-aminoadipate 6-kinase